jgi:hypothetical protein
MHRRPIRFRLLLSLLMACSVSSLSAASSDSRGVTLLVQGAGPIPSLEAAEQTWGQLKVDVSRQLRWSGFVGHLVYQHGWKFGGVLRSHSEKVTSEQLDASSAVSGGRADFFLLASSLVAQQGGLESRAHELASAVSVVKKLTGARQIRLLCYSAGGISARIWLQNALAHAPYEKGTVSQLITVGTPHLGVGGVVQFVSRLRNYYAPLAPNSTLLQRINEELDLPSDVRFTSVVIQGTGPTLLDSGSSYQQYLRLSADQLARLPPLMQEGHDGVVHCLSAQLHLTPTAARYENRTNRPVDVVFCRLPLLYAETVENFTIHTLALRDERLWRTLSALIEPQLLQKESNVETRIQVARDDWAREIAMHHADCHIQERYVVGRIRCSELTHFELAKSKQTYRCRWKSACKVEFPRLFHDAETRSYSVTGAFDLTYDRFGRPDCLSDSVIEIESENLTKSLIKAENRCPLAIPMGK